MYLLDSKEAFPLVLSFEWRNQYLTFYVCNDKQKIEKTYKPDTNKQIKFDTQIKYVLNVCSV